LQEAAVGTGCTCQGLRGRITELETELAERKRVEKLLRLTQCAVNEFPGAALWVDPDARIIYVNEATCRALGFSKEELLHMTLYDIDSSLSEEAWSTHWEETRRQRSVVLESQHRTKDGETIPVEISANYQKVDGSGYNCLFVREISKQRLAEEALQESESKYKTLVENAKEGIFIAQDGAIRFANKETLRQLGHSFEEITKSPFTNFIHPDDREMVVERHVRRLRGEDLPSTYPFRILDGSGGERWVELSTVVVTWEGRPATLNFLRDITEKKELELQLAHAQKMEAIGTLAGGVAHDFNNLLMAMQGNLSLMLLETSSGDANYERLQSLEQSIQSGASLTRQLLGFARHGTYQVKPTDPNSVAKRSSGMFWRTRKEISLQDKYQNGIWAVDMDEGQIEQVLLNLYVNAWQAMPGGGKLTLETKNVTLDALAVKPYGVAEGRYVRISVTDTGSGMDEAVRRRVFEPFFTTKEMGRGTGLGLASAYGIIQSHGGFINVHSEQGTGTTFHIFLPASDKEVASEPAQTEPYLKGNETILLVDDEAVIVEVGKKLLEVLGYRVMTARSGKEAVELYQKPEEAIDLVILDMIMPGMSGGETYDNLVKLNPDVRVLLSSGYSASGQANDILERGCDGFIQKPFDLNQLSQKTREILGTEKAAPLRSAQGG
jgi:PAS domain S-box-containing protein